MHLWDKIKWSDISIIRVPEGEGKKETVTS